MTRFDDATSIHRSHFWTSPIRPIFFAIDLSVIRWIWRLKVGLADRLMSGLSNVISMNEWWSDMMMLQRLIEVRFKWQVCALPIPGQSNDKWRAASMSYDIKTRETEWVVQHKNPRNTRSYNDQTQTSANLAVDKIWATPIWLLANWTQMRRTRAALGHSQK